MANIPFSPASRAAPVPAYLVWSSSASIIGQEALHFDAVMSEVHTRGAEVTEHSVETGAAIVDHIRPLADQLTLEVFVSETPVYSNDSELLPLVLDLPKASQTLITGLAAQLNPGPDGPPSFLAGGTTALIGSGLQALGILPGPPTQVAVLVQQFDADHPYIQTTFDTLTKLRNTGTLLDVITPKQLYQNMVVKEITMRRDPRTGSGGATFTLDLKQIRIVSSNIVQAPLPSVPAVAPTAPQGKQDPAPTPDQKKKSFLKWAKQKVGL